MHRDQQPVHDIEKSDVFSLGLTALQMSILQPVNDIYDFDLFTVKEKVLGAKLKLLTRQYSENLLSLITRMLATEEDARPSFLELFQQTQLLIGASNSAIDHSALFSFNESLSGQQL